MCLEILCLVPLDFSVDGEGNDLSTLSKYEFRVQLVRNNVLGMPN